MKVLVTGGLGVIGSATVQHYLSMGNQVFVIDAAEEPRNEWVLTRLRSELDPGRQSDLMVDCARLETYPQLDARVGEADIIIHAAAHTGIPHSAIDPSDDWASNVEATRQLLESMRRVDAKAPTVLMSSVKPYALPLKIPVRGINETVPLEPDEPYAASKMAQSALGMAYARSYGLPVTVLRFSNLYGPAPCHGPRHGWLTWFCIAAAIGRQLEVQGGGNQVRDMLYSDDVVNALVLAVGKIRTTQGRIFNVGGGPDNRITVMEAAGLIARKTGASIYRGPGRQHEDQMFWTDYREFNRTTTWRPKVGVHDGIERVLSWATNNSEALRPLYEGQ